MAVDYRTPPFSSFAQGALLGFMALTAASAWTTVRWAAAEIEDSGDAREHLLSFERAAERGPEKGFSGWASLRWDFARPVELAIEAPVVVAQAHAVEAHHVAPVRKKAHAHLVLNHARPKTHLAPVVQAPREVAPEQVAVDDASELRTAFAAIRAQRRLALAALDAAAVASEVADLILPGEVNEVVAAAAPVVAKQVTAKVFRRVHRVRRTAAPVQVIAAAKPEPRMHGPATPPMVALFSTRDLLDQISKDAPSARLTSRAEIAPPPEPARVEHVATVAQGAPVQATPPPTKVEVRPAAGPEPPPPRVVAQKSGSQHQGLHQGALDAFRGDYSNADTPEHSTVLEAWERSEPHDQVNTHQATAVIVTPVPAPAPTPSVAPTAPVPSTSIGLLAAASTPTTGTVPVVVRPVQPKAPVIVRKVEPPAPPVIPDVPTHQQEVAQRAMPHAPTLLVDGQALEVVTRGAVTDAVNDVLYTTSATPGQWRLASAPGHWRTLYWRPGGFRPGPQLLSDASLWLLARMGSGSQIQDLGVVVARVPAGWRAQLKGRADSPIQLDESSQRVSEEDTTGERTVVFLNAEPGMQILSLTNAARGETGAAVIPVLPGVASALPEITPHTETISGWLMQAESAEPEGLEGVYLSVVGHGKTGSSSGKSGRFQIAGVVRFSGMPLYLQAEGPDGYKHRYAVHPGEEKDHAWYYFSHTGVDRWVGQLPGGISNGSGMVVAAFTGLLKGAKGATKVSIHPLLADVPYLPEAYGLAPSGRLEPMADQSPDSGRVLGVQVPEGLVKVQLTDQDGTRYSELVPVTRDVLNVLTPR
ncbi:MAG TPA: hypothetical protein VL588_04960 [Bdellovibrionota bacterium]|jgi:hypothetical protein|nr:hypothetical protein [Bdellovibrionota bacterium]